MFIASSVEGKRVADALSQELDHSVHCDSWTTVFPLSDATIDSLLTKFPRMDFGAFVLSADDKSTIRDKGYEVARDNVIFEAGIFMGVHGKRRTFLITPRDISGFHIPSDLLGITTSGYESDRAKSNPRGALHNVATDITDAIREVIGNERKLDVVRYATEAPGAYWPLKGFFKLTNHQAFPVALRSLSFDVSPEAPLAPDAKLMRGHHVPSFLVGNDKGLDLYEETFILRPAQSLDVWIPFDAKIGLPKLKGLVAAEQAGAWHFEEVWLDDSGEKRRRALAL